MIRFRPLPRDGGAGGAGEVALEHRATCCIWVLISIVARRFETLLEMLANSVTTAAIISSVIAIAISISTSVMPRLT